MPALRTAAALGVVTAIATAGVAQAAPKKPAAAPVCNLVTDAEGDSTGGSSNLDIVSGDVASDAKSLTGVIRVKKLTDSDGTAPTGVGYQVRFTLPGRELPMYLLASNELGSGSAFEFGEVNGTSLNSLGEATGTFDLAKSEVRITAPAALDGSTKATPGTKISSIRAFAQRRFVVLLSGADSTPADALGTYTAGAPSCVKPGK